MGADSAVKRKSRREQKKRHNSEFYKVFAPLLNPPGALKLADLSIVPASPSKPTQRLFELGQNAHPSSKSPPGWLGEVLQNPKENSHNKDKRFRARQSSPQLCGRRAPYLGLVPCGVNYVFGRADSRNTGRKSRTAQISDYSGCRFLSIAGPRNFESRKLAEAPGGVRTTARRPPARGRGAARRRPDRRTQPI